MNKRILYLAGAAAPILYLFAVVLGGLLRPDYSHISNAISELLLAGAPNKTLLDTLFIIYNLLCLAGSIGIIIARRSARMTAAGWCLLAVAVAGVFMTTFFPQDPRGAPATFAGTMHLVTAGIESLGLMIAMLLVGLDTRPDRESLVTFGMLAAVFITGGSSAALIGSPIMGLLERGTIGLSLLWQLGLYLRLWKKAAPIHS
jgi:hypothetical membrane protein